MSDTFDLQRFIKLSSREIPTYISDLKDKQLSSKKIKLIKYIISLYLKEYQKFNSNKFLRNKFNPNFSDVFISQLLPEKLKKIAPRNFKIILNNFIHHLRLQRVLDYSLNKNIIENHSYDNSDNSSNDYYRYLSKYDLSVDKVEALRTKQIIKKIRRLGIDFKKREFISDTHKYFNTEEIYDHWISHFSLSLEGREHDFLYYAVRVLWDRISPKAVNFDKLETQIEIGFRYFRKNKYKEASLMWMDCWELLKKKATIETRDIDRIIYALGYHQMEFEFWCQNFLMAMNNSRYFEESITIGREIIQYFSELSTWFISTIKTYIADAFFAQNKIEEGERNYSSIVTDYPNDGWGYIDWANKYADFRNDYFNAEKAYRLYNKAKKIINPSEHDIVEERLMDLKIHEQMNELKHDLLNGFKTYYEETSKNEKEIEKLLKHVETFLGHSLFQNRGYLEDLIDEKILNADFLVRFLGEWSISHEIVKTREELRKLLEATKEFMYFLLSSFDGYTEEEIEEIKSVLNSQGFFMDQFKKFREYMHYKEAIFERYKNTKDIKHLENYNKMLRSGNDKTKRNIQENKKHPQDITIRTLDEWKPQFSDWKKWHVEHKD